VGDQGIWGIKVTDDGPGTRLPHRDGYVCYVCSDGFYFQDPQWTNQKTPLRRKRMMISGRH